MSARESWPLRLPLRWRDYDWIGHVNHISYLDLVLEALAAAGESAMPSAPRSISMEFVAPRTVGVETVLVDRHDRAAGTPGVTFTISSGQSEAAQLHARITLRDGSEGTAHPVRPNYYTVVPRLRDVLDGPAVDVTFLDWLQESRGDLMRELFFGSSRFSVAVAQLEYERARAEVGHEREFRVSSGISVIGRTSFKVHSVLQASSGDVLASAVAVMVKVSLDSGRSAALTDEDRRLVRTWQAGETDPPIASTTHADLA